MWARLTASALAIGLSMLGAKAQDVPLDVVYGNAALSREGDLNHRYRVYVSLPAETDDRVYVRVFDPDTGGAHDTLYGAGFDTTTSFLLFGGDGAFTNAIGPVKVEDGAGADPQRPPEEEAAGDVIYQTEFGPDGRGDDEWVALVPLTAAQGELIDGRAYFRLDILGTDGNDANVFRVELSSSASRSQAVEGARIFSYEPTLRWPDGQKSLEVGFNADAGAQISLQNFDAARATIEVVSTFATQPLKASRQDVWAVDSFTMPDGPTALQVTGGREQPNDLTLSLFDEFGRAIAFDLPARLVHRVDRPEANGIGQPLADCRSVAFDASASRGSDKFTTEWLFGDGARSSEAVHVHRYAAPGRYSAELRVIGDADRIGSGASLSVPVHIRNAPVARPGQDITVAPGDEVLFDGGGSEPSDLPIDTFAWSFGDGNRASGVTTQHRYERSGLYRATLRVTDSAKHPCNFGVAQRVVKVNFPPRGRGWRRSNLCRWRADPLPWRGQL